MAPQDNDIQTWMATADPVAELRERRDNGWLAANLPELEVLWGIPQPAAHHPEIDTGRHIELVLARVSQLSADPRVRFAALVHDLGKGLTPEDQWPQHINHEVLGEAPVRAVVHRFDLPEDWAWLGVTTSVWHLHAHRALDLKASSVVRFLRNAGCLERPALFEGFLLACQADAQGRLGREHEPYPQAHYLRQAFNAITSIPPDDDEAQLHQQRVSAVKRVLRAFAI